ncbi:hypothetical protein O6H91_04G094400 [Diphasiastrum complanatum]|uniref:Uncharacterized protein n=1 Tax=Diphasiastrum complanatum TaxID=34168 RepID=A0ACC2DZE9_DIPCM|nr:hypothetical protein O6H91_04G094400 [Diphasiastrum complanatum]
MHQDHYGRSYNDPPAGRNEMIRKPRSSQSMHHGFEDHRMYNSQSSKEQEVYLQVAGRGFHSTGYDMKQGQARDDEQQKRDERNRSMYGNAAAAAQWEGEGRGPHGLAACEERTYREMDGGRGEVSGVSHSEESEGYGEEDGDLEEEEEQEILGGRDGEGEGGDRGAEAIQRAYQSLSHSQMVALEGRQDPSGSALRLPNSFQTGIVDRDRVSKASPANPLGIFLSSNPQSCVSPFSSPTGAQNGQHGESNGFENGGRELVLREAVSSREGSGQAVTGNTMNYYTALLHLPSGLGAHKGESGNDSGCSGERSAPAPDQPLRVILSDHLSGALMDDATIFPCGHSFGNAGLQRVIQTNACIICGITVRPESGAPNYALRAAVHAFRREQAQWNVDSSKSAKRKREVCNFKFAQSRQLICLRNQPRNTDSLQLEVLQEQFGQSEQSSMDGGRAKGVQFPYVVNDRVLIKGNKRTPERFVGREAIITTQCLNGWYLVRTLDNGESVRLQYRSLQKIGEFG